MTRAAKLALLLVLPLAGCSLSGAELARSDIAQNQCKTDDECFGGRCVDNVCLGSDGSLQALLVAVTPPPTLSGFPSVTYYRSFGMGELVSDGSRIDLDLQSVDLQGAVSIDTTNCSAPTWGTPAENTTPNGGIPANVTFSSSARAIGVPIDTYLSSYSTNVNAVDYDWYKYHRTLPSGVYDVYITPQFPGSPSSDGGTTCGVPPRFIRNQQVSPTSTTLNFKLPASSTLTVDVTWPLTDTYTDVLAQSDDHFINPLDGWTLDLIEPNTGRVLSTQAQLKGMLKMQPVNPDTSVTYEVTLVYAPIYDAATGMSEPIGSDVLRLTPPALDPRDGLTPYTSPVILAQLDGALVDAGGKPMPTQMVAQVVEPALVPAAVHVEFQTGLASDGTPVPASVFMRATSIDGITGISTAFSRGVNVGADGVGDVELLPGHYHVTAAATTGCSQKSCLGTVETDWVVAAAPGDQFGKVIEFEQATDFSGQAYVYGGAPAVGATVSVVASPLIIDPNVLNVGDGSVAPVPQSSSGVVDSDGAFAFAADPGTYVLRVQPDPSTSYGWYVRPGLVLPDQADALAELDLDLPIVYKGTVSADASNGVIAVPRALIRAYAYVDDKGVPTTGPDTAVGAVQVAETYSEDSSGTPGAFTLLIPPSLVGP